MIRKAFFSVSRIALDSFAFLEQRVLTTFLLEEVGDHFNIQNQNKFSCLLSKNATLNQPGCSLSNSYIDP